MHAAPLPEAIDTRLIFRLYAWTAIAAGFSLLESWTFRLGPELFAALQPAALVPYGEVVLPRVTGTAFIGLGFTAFGFAAVEDPIGRRRGLLRFAIGHVVFGLLFAMITHAILGSILPGVVVWTPLIVGGVLLYLAVTASTTRLQLFHGVFSDTLPPHHAAAIVDRPSGRSLHALRSQYEEQISQAARQEERTRLARDLHDAVKQQLFVIQTSAATVSARFETDAPGALAALDQVRGATREAMAEMEALIDQLQAAPMENVGLVESLRKHCDALAFRTGADVRLQVGELPASEALEPGTQQTLSRFAQEALANVARHARARSVTVTLGVTRGSLDLTIADDGAGFDVTQQEAGMGRANMLARAGELGGTFFLTSTPGSGTTVRCSVPFLAQTPSVYCVRAIVSLVSFGLLAGMFALIGRTGGLSETDPQHELVQFGRSVVAILALAALITGVRYIVAYLRVHRRTVTLPARFAAQS